MKDVEALIPTDVTDYAEKRVKRRKRKSLLVFLGIILFFTLLCVFYWNLVIKAKLSPLLFTAMASIIIAMAVSKFPWSFRNKSIVGIVTDVTTKEECDTEYLYTRMGAPYNKINKQILHIDSLNGKKHYVKELSASKEKMFKFSSVYDVGDVVLYVDGTNCFFAFPKDEKSGRTCVICGFSNSYEKEDCSHCLYTLIRGSKNDIL